MKPRRGVDLGLPFAQLGDQRGVRRGAFVERAWRRQSTKESEVKLQSVSFG